MNDLENSALITGIHFIFTIYSHWKQMCSCFVFFYGFNGKNTALI